LNGEWGLMPVNEQAPMAKPQWRYLDAVQRGMKIFDNTTVYAALEKGGPFSWLKERNVWQQLLVDWYAGAPYLFQGTITFKILMPEIRVGHRIKIMHGDSEDQWDQYYVEGVSHIYNYPPGAGSTTLVLTHGFTGTDETYLRWVLNLGKKFMEVQPVQWA
jgi:hypothetical protein